MTWLSRLLPQSSGSQRLANNNYRTRQGQRRRRMMSLEALEGRTLLSNVMTSFPTPSSPLTITGDSSNDYFSITLNSNGTVTVAPGFPTPKIVPGVGVVPASTINGSSVAYTTPSAVTSIIVSLPGTTNHDFVTLTGPSKTVPTTVKTVSVTATGAGIGTDGVNGLVVNTVDLNSLTVSDTFTSATNAVVWASVSNSSFTTLSITQTGGGPNSSSVSLTSDSASASAVVSLGNANVDSISLSGNTFATAMTTLLEGNGGPSNSNSLGNSDTVSVTGSSYKSLNVNQLLNGTHDNIKVTGILISEINSSTPVVVDGVSVVPNGVFTVQGNGAYDNTSISGVSYTPIKGLQLPLPKPLVLSNITVVQGNGSVGLASPPTAIVNDSASVTTSSVPGNISITQTDLLANSPSYNMAMISGDTAGGTITISQGNAGGTTVKGVTSKGDQATVTGSSSGGLTSISQGSGINDFASVTTSSAGGITITQTDVATNTAGDTALVMTDTVTGSVTIMQGAASGDTATIDPTTITGNASITQGNGSGDTALVDASVGGSVTISQGSGSGDKATVEGGPIGGSVTITQTDLASNSSGDTATVDASSVGGSVTIKQGSGSGDTATVEGGPIGGSVLVNQGSGSGDSATEDATSVGGSVTITQTDVASNGSGDTATVENGTIGGSITISQGSASGDTATILNITDTGGTDKAPISISIKQLGGNGDSAAISFLTVTGGTAATPIPISISQGAGSGDSAEIDNVTAPNSNVTITQTDVAGGSGDTAYVLNVTTGTNNPVTGFDFNGTVTISQGSAPGDVALVQDGSSNNIAITQGDNVQVLNGSTTASDIAEVNRTSVFSNISIIQGTGSSTAPDAGNYVAAIAFDYLGLFDSNPGTTGSGSVTAGGSTLINQHYANNMVFLGDSDDSFSTVFLDVFTGSGGGAFVMATNTTVFFGPLGVFSPIYTIEGGGNGNTYVDGGGNSGVTVDPANFNS